MSKEFRQKSIIESGLEAFTLETEFSGMTLENIERKTTQKGEVLRAVQDAESSVILTKNHIERPMEIVFNRPVVDKAEMGGNWRKAGKEQMGRIERGKEKYSTRVDRCKQKNRGAYQTSDTG